MRSRVVVGCAVAVGLGASTLVFAADMPAKAPVFKSPVAVAATNWTGFYFSGGGGYGLWAADTTTTIAPGSPTAPVSLVHRQGGKGWVGRVGGGFDYQLTSRIVAGVFADFDFSSIEGTIIDPATSLAGQIKQTRSWAVGGRAGWLMTPELLSYFNGGYTNARFSSASMFDDGVGNIAAPGTATGESTPAFTTGGWFLGGGTETALTGFGGGGWFWRNEYRYAYYRNRSLADTGSNPFVPINNNINFKPTVQTVTTQLVYKFNSGIAAPAYQAPQTMAPANWSGLYVNGGGGYGLWAADTATTVAFVKQTQGGKGWLGKVGGGFDHQFSPRIVAGVFADVDASSLKGTIQDQGPFPTLVGDIRQTRAWAVGGRAGWLITPAVLSYLNGGYTNARFSSVNLLRSLPPSLSGTAPGFSTPAFTADGWFIGGGTETALNAFGGGWFWRNEYRYARYGSETVPEINLVPASSMSFKPTVQTVTTQVVYRFNWGR